MASAERAPDESRGDRRFNRLCRMDMTREERITAAAIIMRDAVEEMLAQDATSSSRQAANHESTSARE